MLTSVGGAVKSVLRLEPVVSTRKVVLSSPSMSLSNVCNVSNINLNESKLELDSHADTCVVGSNALIIFDYDRPVTVYGYDKNLGAQTFRTVSAVLGYVHPYSGDSYFLVIHQAIEIPHLDHHLLCPMQCRVNGVTVNDTPRFLVQSPDKETHAIIARMSSQTDEDGLTVDNDDTTVIMPLRLQGVTSYLNVFKPRIEDWDSCCFPRLDFTSDNLSWNPETTLYQNQEEAMLDVRGDIVKFDDGDGEFSLIINSLSTHHATPSADITDDDNFGTVLINQVQVSSAHSNGKVRSQQGKAVDAQTLAKRWMIPLDRARNTILKTTQRGVRTVLHPNRSTRFPTNDRMLRYPRVPHPLFTDTLFAGTVSKRGNKCSQIFGTSFGWARAYPMQAKSQAPEALRLLFRHVGVPPRIIADHSKEQHSKEFLKVCREADCHKQRLEPYSQWGNAAEINVRELKRASARKMMSTNSPKKLWDHSLELEAIVRSHTAHDHFGLDGEVPETLMTGRPGDISHICEYSWYQWVMYYESDWKYPNPQWQLGRYLGPAVDVGSMMTAKILMANGQYLPRTTYRRLTIEEENSPTHIEQRRVFTELVNNNLGDPCVADDFPEEYLTPEHEQYEDYTNDELISDDPLDEIEMGAPDDVITPEVLPTPETNDNYVGAEIMLSSGNELKRGRVMKRKRDALDQVIGRASDNPILDTRMYVVKLDDGEVTEATANVIAQSMYAMCDEEGERVNIFDAIIDHKRCTTAATKQEQIFVGETNGRTYYKRSTRGWLLCVQWKDGSTSWEKLSNIKECYPVQAAEYAVARELDDEPAFNWWVKQVLRKRDRIISQVQKRQTRYLKKTTKFGIELPKTAADAYALDKKNKNTLWADAIAKEMKNVKVAFQILSNGEVVPHGYTQIRCHMIFDVKMEDFRRKARLVAGGHVTEAPKCMTYSSVVARDTVRLALTLAALNNLEVKAGDVMNAYITAPTTERVWTILGPEFGDDAGKKALIVRSLYGLKSSSAAFRAHLATCMRDLGYKSCHGDNDLWLKPEVDGDGNPYYSYILNYVDDILVIRHEALSVLTKIDKYFTLKPDSIGDPDVYLGAKLKLHQCENDVYCWTLSPSKYVQEAVRNCREHLKTNFDGKYTMSKKMPNPFVMGYDADMDDSEECNPKEASYFQSLIGVMRWMVELGRVDIHTEVSILSSFLACPGKVTLKLQLGLCLTSGTNTTPDCMDPTYPDIDTSKFNDGAEWKEFYW